MKTQEDARARKFRAFLFLLTTNRPQAVAGHAAASGGTFDGIPHTALVDTVTQGLPMPLNDAKVKNAKRRQKAYRLSDERGMYLEVAPSGGK